MELESALGGVGLASCGALGLSLTGDLVDFPRWDHVLVLTLTWQCDVLKAPHAPCEVSAFSYF